MISVFNQIQKHYDELSSTEQLVIDFILKYEDIDNLKLKIIQEHLHISAPTIIRAVKKLNYRSFTEFKYALITSRSLDSQTQSEKSFEAMLSLMVGDFHKTIEMMDKSKLLKIADIILESRRIFCVGIGSSASVVNSLNRKLKSLGLWSNDFTEVFPIRDIPDVAVKEDCLLLFSLSGSEQQILDVVSSCKVKGVRVISITGISNNDLTNLSDISLLVHQSIQQRKKLRSRLMLNVASEVIFETVLLLKETQDI